jgi:hypothetical protein
MSFAHKHPSKHAMTCGQQRCSDRREEECGVTCTVHIPNATGCDWDPCATAGSRCLFSNPTQGLSPGGSQMPTDASRARTHRPGCFHIHSRAT